MQFLLSTLGTRTDRWLNPVWSLVIILLLAVLAIQPVFSQETITEADREAIRRIIQSQVDAFLADDAERAFGFASPGIQARFGNPENFMAMVKSAYQPVYRPKAVHFEDLISMDELVAQRVLIMDSQGKAVVAIYPMEQQSDGSWRIAGCFLVASDKQML